MISFGCSYEVIHLIVTQSRECRHVMILRRCYSVKSLSYARTVNLAVLSTQTEVRIQTGGGRIEGADIQT